MRDRINNTVERLDEIGHDIYLIELTGWKKAVNLFGMGSPLATAFDLLSISIGIVLLALTTGAVMGIGAVLLVAGVFGMIRRYLT